LNLRRKNQSCLKTLYGAFCKDCSISSRVIEKIHYTEFMAHNTLFRTSAGALKNITGRFSACP
jgi:hypothetical protein